MVDLKNMKYGDFEKIVEKIKNNLVLYEKINRFNDENDLIMYLSDGTKINVSIPRSAVAHLLGINTEYLKSSGCFSEKNSYVLLEMMVNDTFNFYNRIRGGNIEFKSFINQYIDDKLEIFSKHFRLELKKIEFVCRYDSSLSWVTGEEKKDVDYIIVSKEDENLILLGIKFDKYEYIPVTSQIIDVNTEHGKKVLSSFINNQVVTIPETLISFDGYRKFLYEEEVFDKINNIKNSYTDYNIRVDVSHYCSHILENSKRARDVISTVTNALDSKMVINSANVNGYYSFPKYLKNLIDRCNSVLSDDNDSEIQTDELRELKEALLQIEKLKEANGKLMEENSRLSSENSKLNDNNTELNTKLLKIRELVK